MRTFLDHLLLWIVAISWFIHARRLPVLGITVTPGTQLSLTQKWTRPLLNMLGLPTVALDDGEITSAKMANKAITPAKLDDESRSILNGFKNQLINGKFDFARRDNTTNNPASNTFCFDRWRIFYDGTVGTMNVGTIASNAVGYPALEDYTNQALRWLQTVAATGDTFRYIEQRIEDARKFSGKNVTLSFFGSITAGQNYTVEVIRNYGTGGSPSAQQVLYTTAIAGAGGWQKQELSFTMSSVQGKSFGTNNDHYIAVRLKMPLNVIYDFYLALIQFELGSVASAFEQRQITVERFLCDRYYQKTYDQAIFPGAISSNGITGLQTRTAVVASVAGTCRPFVIFPVRMRVAPTVVIYSYATGAAAAVRNFTAGNDRTGATASAVGERGFSSIAFDASSANAIALDDTLFIHYTADAEL